MAERALEWRVEETCLNAWPALREVLLDGWVLRFSEGLTRRTNSANPLRPVSHADLQACEMLYRRLGLPTIFRVLSLIILWSTSASWKRATPERAKVACSMLR